MKANILEAARVIRSKNSGPYELTLDILFRDARYFRLFREKDLVNRELIARLYGVSPADVSGIVFFEPAHAVKITLRRRAVSGAPGDTDVYGAQQHAPLLNLEFEDDGAPSALWEGPAGARPDLPAERAGPPRDEHQ